MLMLVLLGLAPLAVVLHFVVHAPALLVFVIGGAAVAVLAEWMRRATEQIAVRAGPAIGGLLNISFGSAAELVLMLFVIARGHPDVVRAQITGSIMGTSLLGLGLACLVGGVSREEQVFSQKRAGHLSSLLLIVVAALLLPAVFDHADLARAATAPERRMSEEGLGVVAAVILLSLYIGNLVFTLITHRDVFAGAGDDGEEASWSLVKAVGVLVAATVAVAVCADIVSGALENASRLCTCRRFSSAWRRSP